MANNNTAANFQRQQLDNYKTYKMLEGRSLREATKDKAFVNHIMDKHQRSIIYSMGDSPYAEIALAELDRRRMILDMQQYDKLIERTNAAVKEQAKKAIEKAIDEVIKDFK